MVFTYIPQAIALFAAVRAVRSLPMFRFPAHNRIRIASTRLQPARAFYAACSTFRLGTG